MLDQRGGAVVGGIIGAAIGLVLFCAYFVPLMRGALERTPAGVLKRLRSPGAEHHVRLTWLTATGGTWNPEKPPGIGNPIFTRGNGTYRLADDATVELTWNASGGETRNYRGTVPDRLRPGSPQRRRARHALHLIAALYAVVTIAGFAVGYVASHGGAGPRLGYGGLGVLAGWVLIWFVVMVINVARGTGSALSRSS
jgi:hypothetical protein